MLTSVLFLLPWLTTGSEPAVATYLKPTINGSREEQIVKKHPGETLVFVCDANSMVVWELPNNTIYKGYVDPEKQGRLTVDKESGFLKLRNLSTVDTGYYTCKQEPESGTIVSVRSYVYVTGKGRGDLFLHWKDELDNYSHLIAIERRRGGYVDCKVTNPLAEVALIYNRKYIDNIEYDPKRGFRLEGSSMRTALQDAASGKPGECVARLNGQEDRVTFLLLTISEPHPLKPEIVGPDPPFPYRKGPLRLSCLNKFKQHFQGSCKWQFGSMDDADIQSRLVILQNVDPVFNVTLYFAHLTEADSGVYTCECKLTSGGTTAAVHKQITVSPNRGFVETLNDNVEIIDVNYMETITMVVRLKAWPLEELRSQWFHSFYRVGEERYKLPLNISEERVNERVISQTANNEQIRILEISNASVNDTGVYICFLSTGSVSTMLEYQVFVHTKPVMKSIGIGRLESFKADVDSRFLQYREKYSIICRAEGYPQPDILLYSRNCLIHEGCDWKLGETLGNALMPQGKSQFKGMFESVLRLDVIAKVSGSYKCVAKTGMNLITETETETNFIVTDIPEAEKLRGFNIRLVKLTQEDTKENYQTIFEGDSVELKCMYQKYEFELVHWNPTCHKADFTLMTLETGKDQVEIRSYSTNFSDGSLMHFMSIRTDHSCLYTCTAYSREKRINVSRTYNVTVKKVIAPYFLDVDSEPITEMRVQYSEPIQLSCNATGVPAPRYEWLKNGTRLTPKPGVQVFEKGKLLKILRSVKEDSSTYTCKARNRGGTAEKNFTLLVQGLNGNDESSDPNLWIMQVGLGILGAFVVALSALVIALKRRDHLRTKQLKEMHTQLLNSTEAEPKVDPSVPLNDQTDNLTYDLRFEVPRRCVELAECLGTGQFGKVYKASISAGYPCSPQLIVAAKTPRVGKSVEHQSALLSELKIMVYIGFHPNVLSLVGAVTKNMVQGELYVLTEFCGLGCLGDYLRKLSTGFVSELVFVTPRSIHMNYENSGNYLVPYRTQTTKTQVTHYQSEIDPTWPEQLIKSRMIKRFLCTTDLLSYGYQVANGMHFLARKNLIHRDLALRNLLLTESQLVKIGDFGLSRQEKRYKIQQVDIPLPIKWMAIESLNYREYTGKSDVWSFGVVLWEIFSLGQTPYAEQAAGPEFIKWLKSGNRLAQPDHAPLELYHLMRSCWLFSPDDRPDFSVCLQRIADQLERCNKDALEALTKTLGSAQPTLIPDEIRNCAHFKAAYQNVLSKRADMKKCSSDELHAVDNVTYFDAATLQC